jgi:molybdopterin converting factor small subunit
LDEEIAAMTVTVRYTAQARDAAGVASEQIELSAECKLAEALQRLISSREKLRRVLLDDRGVPHASVLIFVDDEQEHALSSRTLQDGSVIDIVPPMSGG